MKRYVIVLNLSITLLSLLFLFGCSQSQLKPASEVPSPVGSKSSAETAETAGSVSGKIAKPALETVTLAVDGMS